MQIAGTWLARDQDDLAGFVDLDPGYIQTSRDRGFYRGGYVALSWFSWNPYSIAPELRRSVKLHLIAQSPERQPTSQLDEVRPTR